MNSKDKIKILFPSPQDVFKMFHIDFNTGYIYPRKSWDDNIEKRVGRPTTDNLYARVSVSCPHLDHIFKRGYTDVLAHRLIYYAHTGELPEKVDHKRKDAEYPDAISNLTASDSIHNRWNTKKVKRRKLPAEQKVDNSPSSYRERTLDEYRGIYVAYDYYWALFDGEIINGNGFVHPILAVNCRNEHLKKEFIKRYGSLDNFPENALDIIDEQQLFLEQMTQEAIEKTKEYLEIQQQIKAERERRSKIEQKKHISKNKISIKVTDDPFDCIGKYDS